MYTLRSADCNKSRKLAAFMQFGQFGRKQRQPDFAHDSAEDADLEYKGDFGAVLSPLIQVILNWGEMKESPMLVPLLRREFFKQTGCNLVIYTDPVTGLRSKNHYVLEGIPKEKQ